MGNANKCPRCGKFILGTYCHNCKEDITKMVDSMFPGLDDTPLGNIFKDMFNKKDTK